MTDQSEVTASWLSVETVSRRRLPVWLLTALERAVAAAWPDQLPVAILREDHKKHDNDLVVMRLEDFESWFGK